MANILAHMPPPKATRRKSGPALVDSRIEKLFYRRNEAAYALGLPLREIDYMLADRRLIPRRHNRSVLIPAAEIRRAAADILRSNTVHESPGRSRITDAYGQAAQNPGA